MNKKKKVKAMYKKLAVQVEFVLQYFVFLAYKPLLCGVCVCVDLQCCFSFSYQSQARLMVGYSSPSSSLCAR